MKYIIFARKCSGTEAERAESIKSQIAQMRKIAKSHNIPVSGVMVEDDVLEAKSGTRSMFRKLLKDITHGRVHGIFTTEFSRLGRRANETDNIIRLLRDGKLQWIRTKDRVMAGREEVQDLDAYGMAHQDAMRKAVSRGMRLRVQHGGFPYRAPWGYTNDRLTKTIKPDISTFPKAKRAWKLLLEGKSLAEIMIALPFGPKSLPSGRATPATRRALVRMFRNPFYCGMVRYQDEVYPGVHIAVVSTDEFEAAQRFLHQEHCKK